MANKWIMLYIKELQIKNKNKLWLHSCILKEHYHVGIGQYLSTPPNESILSQFEFVDNFWNRMPTSISFKYSNIDIFYYLCYFIWSIGNHDNNISQMWSIRANSLSFERTRRYPKIANPINLWDIVANRPHLRIKYAKCDLFSSLLYY